MGGTETGQRPGCGGRSLALVAGISLVVVGIPMLVCPGPGIASILAGVASIAYALTGRRGGTRDGAGR